ncbi:DNA primase/polymerase [Mycobacterium phage YungJamal]|uniref:DNA primase/polymerase n=1 Tax=Mycobacterium phage YungJamal TaxID=1505226 RepID=A0A076GE28_BPMCO|nr:DNA primase/polymerase [Mycobacterium phage YungJamal]
MMPDDNSVGYGDAAQVYWDKGWRGVLPLKRETKWPPPSGFTGYDGAVPSYPDILQWSELYPDGNLCLRLPDGVVGIDVDAYGAKTGAAALAEAERRWGPLPDGPQSTSRLDDPVSGLRLFRVPPGTLLETIIVFRELSIGDIEVIQPHHRYAVCWPSIHPEGRAYWWRNSQGQTIGIPELDDIPELPPSWLEGLKLTPRSLDLSMEGFDVRQAVTAGDPSPLVSARLTMAIKELNLPGTSRHDTCLRHVLAILRMGAEGQPGVEQALTLLREVFVAVVTLDGSRTRDVAVTEFNRMVTNNNVARELSQPGIVDWFKQIMAGVQVPNTPDDDGGDPDAKEASADWASAGAAETPRDASTAAGPPEPNSGGELEALEQDFWTARPQHELIFNAALSRMASPWAVFACVVARALSLVPPSITLPAIVGGVGSLNWFAVIAAKSGGGKGAAMATARDLIPNDVFSCPIGSGEGMVECYNRATPKGDATPDPVISVMFEVEEIDTLGAVTGRAGQTTMTVLRHGFSGERLGFAYRGRRGEVVPAHTYRMTLIASVQPSRAGTLLDDSGGGTPQRFMWFPGRDKRITEDVPGWPTDAVGEMLTLSPMLTPSWVLANNLGPCVVPEEAVAEIRRARVQSMSGDENALDGHALFCREKLAYALAFLDSRVEVNSEDWRLAGLAAGVSDWMREKSIEAYQSSKVDEYRERGQLKGIEAASAEMGKAQEQTDRAQRVANSVLDKIRKAGPEGISNRELTQRVAYRDRGMLPGVLEWAVGQGMIAQISGTTNWVVTDA